MAKKKGAGSSSNGRDSIGRRLGWKKNVGQLVFGGNILMRQRGTVFYPGLNVVMGTDHTLMAKVPGCVYLQHKNQRTYICVESLNIEALMGQMSAQEAIEHVEN